MNREVVYMSVHVYVYVSLLLSFLHETKQGMLVRADDCSHILLF